ncbi:SAM-dependent methyltransferase [Nocardia sp. NBC_01499]|uniref:SAM-dependent methyltransferase n=1 Tax=Nocardia sp. NBC_01499 TaxID=2903597 RepID=UPI003867AFD8
MADENGMVDLKQGQAHSARIYDYFLGGKDNYDADRVAAEQIEQAIPNVRMVARENRDFMNRAVRYVGEQGVRQFIDIGTGIPTAPNLHQVAQETARDARVVYVDNDPIVLAHARALLVGTPEGRTEYIEADVTEPAKILAAPRLAETIDFTQPVALSLIALCHFIPGEQIYRIIEALLEPLAPGSFLVMTHLTADLDPETVQGTVNAYQHSGIAMEARTYDGVARFFADLQLIEPGIVPIGRWYPDGKEPDPIAAGVVALPLADPAVKPPAAGYAAVGRKT